MTDGMILSVGIFAFAMVVIGVILTIREFRTNVYPQGNSVPTTEAE